MKSVARKVLFVAVLGLLLAFATADDSDVVVATKDNYKSTLENNEHVLVEYYAPWCGHCKRLAPEYENAATQLKGKVVLAKVDCTVEDQICAGEQVQGYPTLKFFSSGKSRDYEGERTASGIVSWVTKASGPVTTALTTVDELEAFVARPTTTVVGFFASKEKEYDFFEALARDLEDLAFGFVLGATVDSSISGTVVKVFRDGKEVARTEGPIWIGDGTFSVDYPNFLLKNAYPAVREVNEKVFQQYSSLGKPISILFTGIAGVEPYHEELATGEFKDKISFAYGDGQRFKAQLTRFGCSGDNLPTAVVIDPKTQSKWPFDETKEFNKETLAAFYNSILSAELPPFLRSEEIPADNNGPVKVVVGKNFESVVLDTAKDVLLEIYAPWCGHCKTLAPVYEELGTSLASDSSVVISKVDGTANDIPYSVQGFPTIVFYAANNKTPVEYTGERTLAAMQQFLKDHSSAGATKSHDEL